MLALGRNPSRKLVAHGRVLHGWSPWFRRHCLVARSSYDFITRHERHWEVRRCVVDDPVCGPGVLLVLTFSTCMQRHTIILEPRPPSSYFIPAHHRRSTTRDNVSYWCIDREYVKPTPTSFHRRGAAITRAPPAHLPISSASPSQPHRRPSQSSTRTPPQTRRSDT